MKELKKELIRQVGEVFRKNAENLTLPTSKSIGDNMGEMIEGIFGWLGVWGKIQKEKQNKYIEKFKEKFQNEYEF